MNRPTLIQGLTLIEMLVSLAIIIVITAVALLNYADFSSHNAVKIAAQDLALTVREAQVYGIGVEEGPGSFGHYGVHIAWLAPQDIILFADINKSREYDAGSDTIISIHTLKDPVRITNLCYHVTGDPDDPLICRPAGGNNIVDLAIVFERPNPEPTINVDRQSASNIDVAFVKIQLKDSVYGSNIEDIYIWNSGQITVASPGEYAYYNEF